MVSDKERLDWLEEHMKDLEWCCDDSSEWYELRYTLGNSEEGSSIRQVIDKGMELFYD